MSGGVGGCGKEQCDVQGSISGTTQPHAHPHTQHRAITHTQSHKHSHTLFCTQEKPTHTSLTSPLLEHSAVGFCAQKAPPPQYSAPVGFHVHTGGLVHRRVGTHRRVGIYTRIHIIQHTPADIKINIITPPKTNTTTTTTTYRHPQA